MSKSELGQHITANETQVVACALLVGCASSPVTAPQASVPSPLSVPARPATTDEAALQQAFAAWVAEFSAAARAAGINEDSGTQGFAAPVRPDAAVWPASGSIWLEKITGSGNTEPSNPDTGIGKGRGVVGWADRW
ncbi:MAG: hypothetical protein JF606_26710 [Burkholderiales bacterium]|nr:hypothetical protein [Burkholderiales bacterium]